MEIPYEFMIIESGLFSARAAPEYSYPFIRSLKLKNIILLDPATPSKSLLELVSSENINMVHLVPESWRSSHETSQHHQTWIAISEAVKYTLDKRNYPVMVIGSEVLPALIRRIQNWTISAVLNEFNAYSELSDVRVNSGGSSYLELLELYYGKVETAKEVIEHSSVDCPNIPVIIVELPDVEYRPEWVIRFNVGAV